MQGRSSIGISRCSGSLLCLLRILHYPADSVLAVVLPRIANRRRGTNAHRRPLVLRVNTVDGRLGVGVLVSSAVAAGSEVGVLFCLAGADGPQARTRITRAISPRAKVSANQRVQRRRGGGMVGLLENQRGHSSIQSGMLWHLRRQLHFLLCHPLMTHHLVLRCVSPDLGPVQRHVAQLHQRRCLAQLKTLQEQPDSAPG